MRLLVVAIHDVAPSSSAAAAALRERVAARTGGPVSLLVVPRRAGRESWRAGPEAAWLRARRDAGDEIVAHGWSHVGPGGRDGRELSGRPAAAVEAVIGAGLEELGAAGLSAEGFIAPSYVHPRGAHEACRRAGLRWWATRGRLCWGAGRRPLPSVGLGASTRTRRALSPAAAALGSRALAAAPAVRLDLHPADLGHGRLDRAAGELLDLLLAQGRRPVTHADLLGTGPARRPAAST
jgi:uncharacterized protein